MATTNKKTKEEIRAVRQPLMYVGPTFVKAGVIQNVVYTEIPESAKKVINEVPLFRGLFIYVSKYPEAEKEIRNQEGYTWSAYKAALDYMSKLKGGK